ncbi:MAG: response regulator [Candidatus Riflebacteria bacterium]|nr:response regulator [Candidatus Riflebacteria bacterium]
MKAKILIVDDLPSNIEILADLLEEEYEVFFATSGKEAIDLACKNIPALILMDGMMPGMDGFETCSLLKKIEATKSIPVIFITALDEDANETRGLEAGAIDYITKPIKPIIVKARVKNQIDLQTLRSELEARNLELEAKNKELESFSHSVSHDLRAPLRRIQSFSQILLEDYGEKVDEQGKSFLSKISNCCVQMEGLVTNLLRFSFVSASEIRQEKVDLTKMSEEICTSLKEVSPQPVSEIVIHPQMQLVADSELIKVVMNNLINNAWKFTSKKEKRIIQIGSEKKQNSTTFFVRDNGAGFEMKYSKNLFGALQRLHSKKDFDGHGLGLFTVKRIIQKHGGTIWAEGEENKGATFYFEIPQTTV